MNKWTVRLIGIAILFAAALILFDRWFTPDIPPAIQQSIELSVRGGETHTISGPPRRRHSPPSPSLHSTKTAANPNPSSATRTAATKPKPAKPNKRQPTKKPPAKKNPPIAPSSKTAQKPPLPPKNRPKSPNRGAAAPGSKPAPSAAKKTRTK